MASIKKTCEKILASKEWEEASENDRAKILITLCFQIFDLTRLRMLRLYGKSKWFGSQHIKYTLANVEPPDNVPFEIR